MINGDNECEADMIEDIAMKTFIESEVAMHESMVDGHVENFSTLVRETWVVASESQRETQKTEGGGEETKVELIHATKREALSRLARSRRSTGMRPMSMRR